jgi:hypothetical protein
VQPLRFWSADRRVWLVVLTPPLNSTPGIQDNVLPTSRQTSRTQCS